MPFDFMPTAIPEVIRVIPRRFADERGWFAETYRYSAFKETGIDCRLVQDNHSFSTRGVLRGIHFQRPPSAQAKLVRAIEGRVFDMAVDLRKNSPTFGRWVSTILDADSGAELFIPQGFGHGFFTLSEYAHLVYKVDDEYDPSTEGGVRWDDPELKVSWPLQPGEVPRLSPKDEELPYLKDIEPIEL